MVERLRYGTATGRLSRTAWFTSATYRLGPGLVKASHGKAHAGQGPSNDTVGAIRAGLGTGASHITVGYDYELSKRTVLFMLFSRLENRGAAAYDFAINDVGATRGSTLKLMAVGLRHSF